MNTYEHQLHRDAVQGKLTGVIAGFANYWGLSRFWLRIIALVLLFNMPHIMIPAYIVAALVMPSHSVPRHR